MKKILSLSLLIIGLCVVAVGCSEESDTATKQNQPTEKTEAKKEKEREKSEEKKTEKKDKKETEKTEETASSPEPKIDTSVFAYAKKVDVTDARDITKHIDLAVHMSKDLEPGLATRHVFVQAYEFLQQEDIKGANTVTIGVMNGDIRVAQITVDATKFVAGENLIDSVLQVSTIDKMTPEVKEFGKVMEAW